MFTSSIVALWLVAGTPEVGSQAPDFSALDTEGKRYHLDSLVVQGPVVVAFFPKAFTSG